ncbi:MAG: 7-cyano-7-deazaguanine synthase QueC [Phycisphaerales bacterium]|nr:7-cyano-7-deazaguanine synthase QueC [Phycisphaerales bacterium]
MSTIDGHGRAIAERFARIPEDLGGAVVLLSGGLDSATVLAMACAAVRPERVVGLSIDYGQRHRFELACAERLCSAMRIADHRCVKIDLRAIGGSALTDDGIAVPRGDAGGGGGGSGIPVTYVPARNMIFMSVAVALAEASAARMVGAGGGGGGAWSVWVGVNAVDYSGYPDCRPAFLESFQRTAALGTKVGVEGQSAAIRVVSPLIAMSKAEIIRTGARLGVDYGLTSSCYDPKVVVERDGTSVTRACGVCDSCVIRRRGFVEAGVVDPTAYVGGGAK